MTTIYLDESGDLGWTLHLPNGKGGSSRFITIAGLIIDDGELKHLKRRIVDLYRKYKLTPGLEKKGANFGENHPIYIVNQLWELKLTKCPSLKIIAMTALKEGVNEGLRQDKNIFYNFLLGKLLPSYMKGHPAINLVLDKRTIKVSSGNSFEDHIKTLCWGEHRMATAITCEYDESDQNQGIWVADWMANFVWRAFENKDSEAYDALCETRKGINLFDDNRLFFAMQLVIETSEKVKRN